MDFRRRSLALREFGCSESAAEDAAFWSMRMSMSPTLSRRRSASPLVSPGMGNGSNNGRMSIEMMERNRKEPSFPQSEEEHLYLFHEKIIWSQERSLLPLCHDLADWMNSTLVGIGLTPSNLMETLETGVILCNLAKLIEQKASMTVGAKVKPKFRGRFKQNARRGSFFARDNVAMFINFCKELGVHSNLLFETEDLVSHGEVRSVLVCLLEVGRLSVKYGIDPPTLVALEHQIDKENEHDSLRATTTDEDSQDENKEYRKSKMFISTSTPAKLSDSLDSGLHEECNGTNEGGSGDGKDGLDFLAKTELDLKVNEVARMSGTNCCCVEETRRNFRLRKLSEGKYLINGRTVFVRLLKGVHVMVRIGGGWETLEEFLVRNDPCRLKNGSARRRSTFGVQSGNNGSFGGRPASSPPVMISARDVRSVSSLSNCSTPVSSRPRITPIGTPATIRSQHSSRTSLFT